GFMIRSFIIFHDCTHGSFFRNKKLNDFCGTFTGVITHFAYEKWKREHSIHHATSGNLDKRGIGDIWVMTVKEYEEADKLVRLECRLYLNPLLMFALAPFLLLLYPNRFNLKGPKRKERQNAYVSNAIIVSASFVVALMRGGLVDLFVQLTITDMVGAL